MFKTGVEFLRQGDAAAALTEFEASLAVAADDQKADSLYNIAVCHVRLGNVEGALDALAQAIARDPSLAPEIGTDQDFASLATHPRFVALVDRQASKTRPVQAEADRRKAAPAREGAPASTSSAIVERYRDGYRVGAGLVGLGNVIKVGGAVIGGLALLTSLSLGALAIPGILFLVAGALSGGVFWICGVIVAAHGQTLRATLDTAVSSSRFLTDAECAEAMGLPAAGRRPRP